MLAGGTPKKIAEGQIHPFEYTDTTYLPIYMPLQGLRIPQRFYPYINLLECIPTYTQYIYLSVKHGRVHKGMFGNRQGWHVDNEINYIWASDIGTEYVEMEPQEIDCDAEDFKKQEKLCTNLAKDATIHVMEPGSLYLLNGCIHRAAKVKKSGVRTFVKITCSDRPMLPQGAAHNELFSYDWRGLYDISK